MPEPETDNHHHEKLLRLTGWVFIVAGVAFVLLVILQGLTSGYGVRTSRGALATLRLAILPTAVVTLLAGVARYGTGYLGRDRMVLGDPDLTVGVGTGSLSWLLLPGAIALIAVASSR